MSDCNSLPADELLLLRYTNRRLIDRVCECVLKHCELRISKTNERNFTLLWSEVCLGSWMC